MASCLASVTAGESPDFPKPSPSPAQSRVIRVPLAQEDSWTPLSYEKRRHHVLHFSESGLRISVQQSAMPLFHRLPQSARIRSVRASGELTGNVKTTAGRQGSKGQDDYALRIGMVLTGRTTLSWWERRRAPGWVKDLFALAPEGGGISEVRFLNIGVDSSTIGRTRRHPASQILHEEVVAVPGTNGVFNFQKTFDPPVDVCAIWISADGDDTQSAFDVTVREIVLETQEIKL